MIIFANKVKILIYPNQTFYQNKLKELIYF